MPDKREEILNALVNNENKNNGVFTFVPDTFPISLMNIAKNAMDDYATSMCMELLDYLSKKMVICGHYSSPDGFLFKVDGHELLTKEQLFENFL